MRLFLISLISALISCSDSTIDNRSSTDTSQLDTISKAKSSTVPLLVDTPKVLKAGRNYITIATSPYDKFYFGTKFSPYKMEPYDIANIEQVIDSLLRNQKLNGNFKNKALSDFKYQIFSVKTAKQKLQARIQAIGKNQPNNQKWNSSRLEVEDGSDCCFSIIYDLTDKKILSIGISSK